MRSLRAALACLASTAALGCVTGSYERTIVWMPPDPVLVDGFVIGETTLAECLERLGAPLHVWEYKGDGVALAYGASIERGWNVGVSVPVTQYVNASFDYDDARARLTGVVLFFDAELELEQVRSGYLRVIEGALAPRRPAPAPTEP